MILIDTNVFLEVLLDQPRSDECLKLLERVRRGELESCISRFSLYSIELIMIRYGKLEELVAFLNALAGLRALA